ncbi:MAG: hypothetical protein FWE80_08065 [Oscillospiraceae bacterium]|nr:hypothetical protein [Oscillospiraceae bacterium]
MSRIQQIAADCARNGRCQPQNSFVHDTHTLARTEYADLPQWEKIARSMAEAMVRQEIYISDYDRIIGRIYHLNEKPVVHDADFDFHTKPWTRLCQEIPGYEQMVHHHLTDKTGVGHVTWGWNEILRLGTSGMRARFQKALDKTGDQKSRQFYTGVLIMLEALEQWNDRHVAALRARGMDELAALCEKVPQYPAESFHEAVQAFYMQHIVVIRENPFGGNSIGRLDYYLWPYLERDLAQGICTLEDARELVDELFLRLDERIFSADLWGETVSLGGTHPNGGSAVNPLSHIMIESVISTNTTHPLVYPRLPKNPPADFVRLCARYLREGSNRAQLLNDEAIIGALTTSGVPFRDAVEYACCGCMEIGLQGMTSDYLFNGWHNVPKMLELFLTGGHCLKTGEFFHSVQAKGLEYYENFEDFYTGFIAEVRRILHIFFYAQDVFGEEAEHSRPSYLVSSMIQDCFAKGRNIHGGGARYYDYGSTPLGLPNVADALFAVKKAVFEDKLCSAAELLAALRANFEGYGGLRKQLLAIPKFGQEDTEADGFMARFFGDVADIYTGYTTRFGGTGKCIILTFVWAPEAGAALGATADGNLAGKPVAQGLTPQSSSMTRGLTAAINSCASIPFHKFNGGATTMWDLDPAWASEEVIEALFTTFFENGGQIYQGNTTNVAELIAAQKNPEENIHLIVRVGGFSARFVTLDRAVQDEIIGRVRHNA